MLKSKLHTARKVALALSLAVFFSTGVKAADSTLAYLGEGLNQLIYDLSQSVVTIESSGSITSSVTPFMGQEAFQQRISSGLICDTMGHILVAAESVEGQDRITVRFRDLALDAHLLGVDYHSGLALIKVGTGIGKPIVCSEQRLCAGQMVVMLGNAFGLRASPSVGFCAGSRPGGTMQFNLPLTSGSPGSGVFDLSGCLLGAVIGGIGDDNQVAEAIPAYRIPAVVEYLKERGDRHAGFMGITTVEIEVSPGLEVSTPNTLASVGRGSYRTIDRGVVITSVVPGSAADRAGLRTGDLVFSFKNRPISTATQFAREVIYSLPGDIVDLELVRHNTYFAVQVQIGRKEFSQARQSYYDIREKSENELLADSLTQVINSLKNQVSDLEKRLSRLKR